MEMIYLIKKEVVSIAIEKLLDVNSYIDADSVGMIENELNTAINDGYLDLDNLCEIISDTFQKHIQIPNEHTTIVNNYLKSKLSKELES